jgi:hypothetical protein
MSKHWILTGFVIGMALLMVSGILLLRSMANQALLPIQDASHKISTQASMLFNPTPTILPDPVTIINQIRPLARLETIQYSVEKIITAETGQDVFGPLFGDRLLFVAHGLVIAGVDLSALSSDDLSVNHGILEIKLPEAEIFVATLDNDKSYVYDRETGLFKQPDDDLETLARQAAEEEIRQAAVGDGILSQARLNAEVFLERLMDDLGFEEVIFF